MKPPQPIDQATQDALRQVAHGARLDGSLTPSGAGAHVQPAPPKTLTHPAPLPAEQTDELFARLAVRYPHVWTSQYVGDGGQTDDDALALAVAEWSEALAGLTEAQIRAGLRADYLRADHWPPGPSEFAAMCHGIPTLARVKHILARVGPARTKFTRLVWSLLDTFAFTRADAKYADRLLADAYELAKAHVMGGYPLPEEPSGALEHQPEQRTPARPETVARAVREVTEKLRPKEPDADTTNAASEEPAP